LGVLKDSVDGASSERSSAVVFDPPLPFSKVDAIQNTGFGLLNKVYLQFETAFWRIPSILDGENTLFGNASGMNSHHYMFNDIGKSLGTARDMPPILMSLISGKEAAHCELMSDEEIVNQVLETLRKLFTSEMVTRPVDFRVTRWGSDKFSRGMCDLL
jgi:lysine-specific histone demethylase 1